MPLWSSSSELLVGLGDWKWESMSAAADPEVIAAAGTHGTRKSSAALMNGRFSHGNQTPLLAPAANDAGPRRTGFSGVAGALGGSLCQGDWLAFVMSRRVTDGGGVGTGGGGGARFTTSTGA